MRDTSIALRLKTGLWLVVFLCFFGCLFYIIGKSSGFPYYIKTLREDAHEREKEVCPLCGLALDARMCRRHILCSVFSEENPIDVESEKYMEEQSKSPKKIALTFDDGPSPVWTPKLLEGLKKRGVKATFFVTGENAERYPEIIKKMYKDGHIVGNHTYSHVQLTAIKESRAIEELSKTNEIIFQLTGEYPEYVRPPFGEITDSMEDKLDMMTILWNVDPLDWTTESKNQVVRKVVKNAEENAIILLHDNYKSSIEAALEIVDILQKEGYEFVTVDELILD